MHSIRDISWNSETGPPSRRHEELLHKTDAGFRSAHTSHTFLPAGSDYSYTNIYTSFTSNNRKMLNGTVTYAKGGFFNGQYDMIDAKMVYRYQPS